MMPSERGTLRALLKKRITRFGGTSTFRGGAQFSKVIEQALKAADVIVALWSAKSVESAWVRDEAVTARDTGRLVPVSIDGTEAPLDARAPSLARGSA